MLVRDTLLSLCPGCTDMAVQQATWKSSWVMHWLVSDYLKMAKLISANVHLHTKQVCIVCREEKLCWFLIQHCKASNWGIGARLCEIHTAPVMMQQLEVSSVVSSYVKDQTSCGFMSSSLCLRWGGWGSSSPVSCLSFSASTQLCGTIIFLGPCGGGPSRASMSS